MKTPDIFDLYTDYLITSFSYTTASGLVDNAINPFLGGCHQKLKHPHPFQFLSLFF
jgi:hypothetical protein